MNTAVDPPAAGPTADRAKPRRKRRFIPPGLLNRHASAEFCGSQGVSTWDRNSAAGLTPAPVRIGGSVFWCRAELAEWCLRGCPPRAEWAPVWQAILARRMRGGK